jgi:hypothetical protein
MRNHFTPTERAAAQRALDRVIEDAKDHVLDLATRDPEAIAVTLAHLISVRAMPTVLEALDRRASEPGVRVVEMTIWPAKVGA